MNSEAIAGCCPRFDPGPWNEEEIHWEGKRFLRDRVRSLFHIPLNFGAVMKRNMVKLEGAEARPEAMVVLSDENSLWGADVYIEATHDVPGADMVTLSGTFLCKVFEGPYRDMRNWITEMDRYLEQKGVLSRQRYFFYTTCPKCAKAYGRNYVVILDQV